MSYKQGKVAFNLLRQIWRSTALTLKNRTRIFNTNVKSVLLYGSETWRVTKINTGKLQTFINRCLRNILNIRWPGRISNENLWQKTSQVLVESDIKKLKWVWIGHTLRKPSSNIRGRPLRGARKAEERQAVQNKHGEEVSTLKSWRPGRHGLS